MTKKENKKRKKIYIFIRIFVYTYLYGTLSMSDPCMMYCIPDLSHQKYRFWFLPLRNEK